MNKAELVAEIAKNTGLTKVDSDRATDALLNAVTAALKKTRRRKNLTGFCITCIRKKTTGD